MLTRTEIAEQLKEILLSADDRAQDAAAAATEETKLQTELGLSSVSMLYLVIAIEEEFGIRFEGVSAADFVTFGDVITYVENKLKGQMK